MKVSIACATLSVVATVAARTLTITNSCPYTVWPAIFTGVGSGPTTGWEARSGSSRTLSVPDNWTAGRIWGRRNCDFSKPEARDCAIGACVGGLACRFPGVPPVTLAEFSLRQADGKDFYDVSLVDGFGIPVRIRPSASACHVAECAADLAAGCPSALAGPFDSNGVSLGCKSACFANLDGNQANSRNCCSGQFSTPQTCPRSGVQYYDYFKSRCPNSYVYAYDESSGTALWTCPQQQNSDYTITFCP